MKSLWRSLYRRIEPGFAGSLALALVCVAVAVVARVLLGLIGSTLYFATFFPAILICTLIGGRTAGLLAIPLSIVAVWWAFIPPAYSFGPLTSVHLANITLFALSSLLVVWLAVRHRRTVFELQDRDKQRDLLVHEIEHRGKNMLAVMTSLVQQTVKDKDEANTLINRMCIAADNRDLLHDPSDNAMSLRDLLTATVCEPYGQNRVVLTGPDVRLNGREARSLRIVFHEMATNAVKYGALSEPNGRISIDWSIDGDRLAIVWCERDGPKVSAPSKFNFGSKLINVTLKQMNAELEPTFAETGYCYRIRFALG
ncbi:two-component sensor histidine kinase [Nitrobacteraceae bacterium AZCC 1564]